ncbi:MAG: serine/threonine-protein kinase, partial [Xenococcus sp. MO_188.B8]|nr:serine/threonine-protein kinase [Xenococcus sp. MO_188.B8]
MINSQENKTFYRKVKVRYSRSQSQKSVNKSGLNATQKSKTVVEPDPTQSSRTAFDREDPLEGKTIGDDNRYLLQTLLVQEGTSQVYQALDTKSEARIVAIKLMINYAAAAVDKHLIERFMGEVEAISHLNHPNIVKILDFGLTPDEAPFYGAPFYVMEYFAGKTLQNLFTENKILPLASLLKIIYQVCAGLKQAHQQGIVHRYLNPDTIFLVAGDGFGEIVKIIDFGIIKNLSSDDKNHTQSTQVGSFSGTYRYASPEQCRGLTNIDQRSYVYSLGVILYEAICGNNPYILDNDFKPSPSDWIASHLKLIPKPLKEQAGCENIEDELAAIVMKCLAKSPQDRFSDLGELQNALANNLSVRMRVNYHPQTDTKLQPDNTIQPDTKIQTDTKLQPDNTIQPDTKIQTDTKLQP